MLVLLLLVFGAKRLPELGRSLGEGLRGFKESISAESPTPHLTEAAHQHPIAADQPTAMASVADDRPATPVGPATPAAPATPVAPVA